MESQHVHCSAGLFFLTASHHSKSPPKTQQQAWCFPSLNLPRGARRSAIPKRSAILDTKVRLAAQTKECRKTTGLKHRHVMSISKKQVLSSTHLHWIWCSFLAPLMKHNEAGMRRTVAPEAFLPRSHQDGPSSCFMIWKVTGVQRKKGRKDVLGDGRLRTRKTHLRATGWHCSLQISLVSTTGHRLTSPHLRGVCVCSQCVPIPSCRTTWSATSVHVQYAVATSHARCAFERVYQRTCWNMHDKVVAGVHAPLYGSAGACKQSFWDPAHVSSGMSW